MATGLMMGFLLSNVLGTQMPASNCPMKCNCTDSEVTCHNLTSYPSSFPPATTKIAIQDSHLKEIPKSALNELPDLLSFEISSSKINSINSQAFSDLSVENFTIVNSSIRVLKSKAFEKCIEIDSFLIKDTKIDLIEEKVFIDMYDFGRFKIESSSVGIVQTHAFFNINFFEHMEFIGLHISLVEKSAFDTLSLGGKCEFSDNRIDSLHLDTFTNFLDRLTPTNLTVSRNTVKRFDGVFVTFPFENATHMEIFENVIPCVKGWQNVKSVGQQYLLSNLCQDKSTGNNNNLDKVLNSSVPLVGVQKFQDNESYVLKLKEITANTNRVKASINTRISDLDNGITELEKVHRNEIKDDVSVQSNMANTVTLKQLPSKSNAGITRHMKRPKGNKRFTITPSAMIEETGKMEISTLRMAATMKSDSIHSGEPSSKTVTPFVDADSKQSITRVYGKDTVLKSQEKVMQKTSVTQQIDSVAPNGPTSYTRISTDTWTPTLKMNTEHSARSVSGDATNAKGHFKVMLLFVQCCSLLLLYVV